MLLGVDTGGTFTDFVLLHNGEIVIHKVPSTPSAPEQSIIQGINDLGILEKVNAGKVVIIHGSTVATNAALEGKGVRTVYVANRGLKDILTIGRQTRAELYNLKPGPKPVPVPPELCLETGGRLDAQGNIIEPLTDEDIKELVEQINLLKPDAVAINLLFSFLDDSIEKRIEAAIDNKLFVSRSSFVLPEYREYERGIATWLNAWLGPLIQNYLQQLQTMLNPSPVTVMQSSGGTIDARQAGKRAVNLLLSGPAGGLAAARYMGTLSGINKLLTFDMGGTSTDVALIDGDIKLTNEGRIGNYPVAVPMVDMHTIGAGGGSIAYLDQGGILQVGPMSAGASPGPACYAKGGTNPTVTDANTVLGRLRPDALLAGNMALDIEAARSAIQQLATPLSLSIEETALGIITIANEHMTQALRVISVQRGHSPKDFHLCCFGGAGGLHVCSLANDLSIENIFLPIHGGVLSALGMLVAPRERQLSRTHQRVLSDTSDQEINSFLEELAIAGQQQLSAEGIEKHAILLQPSIDLRYRGQSTTLNVIWQNIQTAENDFHQAHQKRYGHQLQNPVELVNVRQRVYSPAKHLNFPSLKCTERAPRSQQLELYRIGLTHIYNRNDLHTGYRIDGPAIILEKTSTTLVEAGWQVTVDDIGNLFLRKK